MTADLYHDALRELAQAGRPRGRLDHADRSVTLDNPLCGDRVTLDVALDGDTVTAIGHAVRGCLLCEAGAELVARTAPGHDAAALEDLPARVRDYLRDAQAPPPVDGLAPFAPAKAFRSRHRCVTLPFEALAKALG